MQGIINTKLEEAVKELFTSDVAEKITLAWLMEHYTLVANLYYLDVDSNAELLANIDGVIDYISTCIEKEQWDSVKPKPTIRDYNNG